MNIKSFISHITRYDKFVNRILDISVKVDTIINRQQEILMAEKYHDTISDYEWLKYKGISPGGWAVDYAFCYTLARTLNTMCPKNILECGLGQSSRIVHQYASYNNIQATTCEHNEEWITFFTKEVGNKYPINIRRVELEYIEYKGQTTLTYKNIQEIFLNEKFDLIIIDGPFGSKHYSRSQIIELCNNNLKDRFCIIVDDTDRMGEQETIKEIKEILSQKSIDYTSTTYSSIKTHTLICSHDLKFLTSL